MRCIKSLLAHSCNGQWPTTLALPDSQMTHQSELGRFIIYHTENCDLSVTRNSAVSLLKSHQRADCARSGSHRVRRSVLDSLTT